MMWNPKILDSKIAPAFSTFTKADVPDVVVEFSEAKHWLSNHFLNTALGRDFKPRWKQHFMTLLMRCQSAFAFYDEARLATADYLSPEPGSPGVPRVRRYFRAVSLWEATVLNWGMAVEAFNHTSDVKAFEKGDGSVEDRAYLIYNTVKHWGKTVESGRHEPTDTVPLWLTNEGLNTRPSTLPFAELAQLLRDLGNVANKIQHPEGLSGS